MTTVGFLRHNFLPPSETFIYGTLRALRRYVPRVFALVRRMPEKFPWEDVTVLRDGPLGWLEEICYRTTTWSPRFFAWARTVRILHAHMGWTGAHALLAARRFGLPLVTSFYGLDVKLRETSARLDPTYWHYLALARRLFARGDRFLALSRHMERALVDRGCPADKIRIVPIGVDLGRFACERGRPPAVGGPVTVAMIGREVEKKGFDDGLRACAAARDAGVDLRVVVLGTGGPLLASLRRLAADELGLPVEWPDPATPAPRVLAEADILLVPSRAASNGDEEGTPTVICEGSASGLPVVATRHAGIPEQVDDGATGLLVAERDVSALADRLVQLARDPERRFAMGRAGRAKMAREYSTAAHARRLEAVYDEVLGAAAAPRERAAEET